VVDVEPLNQILVDVDDGGVRHVGLGDDVHMSDQAVADDGSAPAG